LNDQANLIAELTKNTHEREPKREKVLREAKEEDPSSKEGSDGIKTIGHP
jgi:hypothetical protein